MKPFFVRNAAAITAVSATSEPSLRTSPSLPRADDAFAMVPVLLMITSVQVTATFSLVAIASLAPAIAATLDVPVGWIGYEVALSYAVAAIASLLAGPAISRAGATRASMLACAGSALALLLTGLGMLHVIMVAALMLGACYGVAGPAASQLLAEVVPHGRRNLLFSVKQTGVPLGAASAMLLLPAIAQATHWRVAIVVAALPQIVLAVALARRRAVWDDGTCKSGVAAHPLATFRLLASNRGIRAIALTSFFYSGIQHTLTTCLLTALVTDLEWPMTLAVVMSFGAIGVGALARLVTGWAADKIVTPRTILISVGIVDVLAGGWLGTVTPATSPSLLLPMLAVLGAFAIGWAGVQQAEAARMSPAGMVGSGTGAVYFGTFVGGMIMPIIFTVLRDLTGRSLLALGIVCCLAAAGPLLIVRGYRGRENAPENASPPAKSGAAA